MDLLDLVHEKGLIAKRAANTQGGEYHSPCPVCGGSDRFVIQPNKQMKNCTGYYFCRQCNARGDSIQFCLDYLGFTNFKEAEKYVEAKLADKMPTIFANTKSKNSVMLLDKPSILWIQQANKLVQEAHDCVLLQKDILQILDKRGLPIEAIKNYKISWLSEDKNFEGAAWGLDKETIWFPAGILIPAIEKNENVIRLKIRRKNWKIDDEWPKYIAISGSMKGLNIIGNKKNPIMIVVESELDAYALHHAVGDFAVIIAIGGCTKNPDPTTDYLAKHKTVLLICHDNDSAGSIMFDKWKALYSHAQSYPTTIGKDIGEAIQQGFDVRSWIIEKLSTQMQRDLNLIKLLWNQEDQELVNWILHYISERTITRYAYDKLEQEINVGLNSPRAQTGELQQGLRLMRKIIEITI